MRTAIGAVLVALLLTTSGCALLPFEASESTPPSPTPFAPSSTPGADSTAGSDGSGYDSNTDTDEIVLRVSDLGPQYNFTTESLNRRGDLSEAQAERFANQSLLRQHQRVFTLVSETTDSNLAPVVISTVAIYESPAAAGQQSPALIQSLREQGATVETVELASGYKVTQVQGQTSTGRHNTMLMWRSENLVVWLVTSSPRENGEYQEQARVLFIDMLVDVP
ncbi:hypothetical protein [Salinigranum halophilum]|uniref:hypothetical protein n=1 Tax=Salinigranum halophilum TaxID=2565931 RepID=UPI0010A7C74B|nr:hypothetical protein [Salinigranum halophilum]